MGFSYLSFVGGMLLSKGYGGKRAPESKALQPDYPPPGLLDSSWRFLEFGVSQGKPFDQNP